MQRKSAFELKDEEYLKLQETIRTNKETINSMKRLLCGFEDELRKSKERFPAKWGAETQVALEDRKLAFETAVAVRARKMAWEKGQGAKKELFIELGDKVSHWEIGRAHV